MPVGIIKWFCEQVNLEKAELNGGDSCPSPPLELSEGENVCSISQIYLTVILKFCIIIIELLVPEGDWCSLVGE